MASMALGAALTAAILTAAAVTAETALAQQAQGQPVPDQSGQVEILPGVLVPGQDVTGQSVPLVTGTPADTGTSVDTGTPVDSGNPVETGTSADTGTAVETVPQPRFEAEAQRQEGDAAQPHFVRAPGADGIEVTPLAPLGGTAADGEASVMQPGAEVEVNPNLPDVLTPRGPDDTVPVEGDTDSRAAARANRFKSAPQDGRILASPTGPAVPIDSAPTELREGVRLRELDKMTGQTETFELAVGETRQVDRLKIRLEACRSPQGNDTHGTIAFLKVWDIREPDDEAFSGWMFAESPSLSALDHPRYDLWVISCTTSSIAVSAPSE